MKRYLTLFLLALVIVFGATAFYFYQKTNADPQRAAQKEALEIVEKVGKHMVLPIDELPTIATVSDPEALKEQSFLKNAKVGQKVLFYTKAKIAILYDPDIDRIINIAPFDTAR